MVVKQIIKKIYLPIFVAFILVSCYRVEIPLFGGTSWEFNGKVIESDINAKNTQFVFVSNDTLEIYEDDILSKKYFYDFNYFTRKGYVKEQNFYFERLSNSEMEVLLPKSKFIFDRIK